MLCRHAAVAARRWPVGVQAARCGQAAVSCGGTPPLRLQHRSLRRPRPSLWFPAPSAVVARGWLGRSRLASAAGEATAAGEAAVAPGTADDDDAAADALLATLSTGQRTQIESYIDTLLEWNGRMNLTAVVERPAVMRRHVVDALTLLPFLDAAEAACALRAQHGDAAGRAMNSDASGSSWAERGGPADFGRLGLDIDAGIGAWGDIPPLGGGGMRAPPAADAAAAAAVALSAAAPPSACVHDSRVPDFRVRDSRVPDIFESRRSRPWRVVDVGTGAGLPGLILAIARPHWRVTLLDSLRKRVGFLTAAAAAAGVRNAHPVWARAEDYGRDVTARDSHDVAVARAVADLRVLAELCVPLVRPGGVFIAQKGAEIAAEAKAARPALAALGAGPPAVYAVGGASRGPDGKARTVVVAWKVGPTPAAFPRLAGTPAKAPL